MRKNYFLIVLAIVFTVNAVAQNIPNYLPKDGLVGYWPFNGNANDESGNGNHGTVNGATLSADRNGKVNSAYSFDGLSNFIKVLNSQTLDITGNQITMSYWLYSKNDINDANYKGLSKGGYDVGSGYEFMFRNSYSGDNGVIHISGGSGMEGSNINYDMNAAFGKWIHLSVTFDNGIVKFYVNGNLQTGNNTNLSSDFVSNKDDLFIGKRNPANGFAGFLKGQLDDIAIYNRALTEQEITSLYTETPITQNIPSYVPTNGLLGYWPFNGNANDESGNGNHGTVNGATLSADRIGKANSAYSFDGNSNNIRIPNSNNLNPSSFTISSWINSKAYATNVNDGAKAIITKWYGQLNCNNYGDNYNMQISIIDNKNVLIGATSLNNQVVNSANININELNKWINFIFIHDENFGQKIFYNGQLVYENKQIGALCQTKNDLLFGADSYNNSLNRFFNGQLDDIAIYNRALTQQEITALYSGATNLASTKVFVDAPATVNQNDTLELTISTEALNASDNVIAFQTDITYDTTRYTFVSNNTVGTLNTKASVDLNTDKKGTIKVGYISTSALQGAGRLLKLKFKANQKVGQGIFGLSNFMYNNTDITSLKNDTVTTLDVTPPSTTITLSQNTVRKGDSLLITVNFSEKMADTPAPAFNLTGQNTLLNAQLTKVNDFTYTYWWVVEKGNGSVTMQLTQGTDLAGNPFAKGTTITAIFNVLPTLFGDIDTNKFIRAYDAALALQYSVGLNPLPTMDPLPWSNWRIAVANVDTIGNVTANDAAFILKHSIGKITEFPADIKKRGGDAPKAEVTVAREGNQLVFRATGTLYAFNVFMKDNFNAFGQPEVKDKNAMIATNITSTTYNVGLASTTPFTENEPFLILPILTNENVQGTMNIVANAQEKALSYGAAAGISTINSEVLVVYPNPTRDIITILDAQGKTVKIIDVQGKEVYNAVLPNAKTEISLKALGAKGMYVVHILDANNLPVQTKQIVLE